MIKLKLILILFIISFINVACFSENASVNTTPSQSFEELQIQLEEILKDTHVPGMSLAIVNREGLRWTLGLGKIDLAHDRQANATTLFRIGSISKGFVSLAILMLAEEEKLSLEDPIQKLVPEVWFDNKWEVSDPVRIVHLLENTTGWDDMHLREFAKPPLTMSSLEALNYDHSSRISRWKPGTRMAYSNSGPAVAAYIVEKLSGKSFEEYIEQKFFKPIEMPTATYFQPASELTTTLYQSDGTTPLPYWNLLYRSIGAINASANDMANYLIFYLNRGNVRGSQVISETLFNQIETPSSTWAAKDGLELGYGLNNYSTICDGFIYHGHDGNLPGALSVMHYMPNESVGYFYSLNSGNREAFEKVGKTIRAYITHQLPKPSIPSLVYLSEKAKTYGGWYAPNSPRFQLFSFLERLIGLTYVHMEDKKLILTSLAEKNATFLPITDSQFLYVPKNESLDPLPTLNLMSNDEGQFIQFNMGLRNALSLNVTMKHIPTWLAIFEITLTGFVLLSLLSLVIYMPFWIIQGLSKNQRHVNIFKVFLWSIIAVLCLFGIIVIGLVSSEDFITRLGNLTVWSFSIF